MVFIYEIIKLTIAGELKDIELSNAVDYTLNEILEMYVLKTSWYTFIGPLQLGATLAKADDYVLDMLKQYGTHAGIAFQIMDDIIGVFGNEDIIGKSNLSDIREGKRTILTCHFLTTASDSQKQEFSQIYGNKDCSINDL